MIDLDAQGNLTDTTSASRDHGNIMDVLRKEAPITQVIQNTHEVEIVPSTLALATADGVFTETGKEYRLRESLEGVREEYDYIIIDTPPALGILTANALVAADEIIIPAQADPYSLEGIIKLNSTLETIRRYCNPGLVVRGILITRYSGRAIVIREYAEMIAETAKEMGTKLFTTRIREGVAIRESQALKQSIFAYAPKSNVAMDYNDLVNEIIKEEKTRG